MYARGFFLKINFKYNLIFEQKVAIYTASVIKHNVIPAYLSIAYRIILSIPGSIRLKLSRLDRF